MSKYKASMSKQFSFRVPYSHPVTIMVHTCVRAIEDTIFTSPHYHGKYICVDHSGYHIHIPPLTIVVDTLCADHAGYYIHITSLSWQLHMCGPFRVPYSHPSPHYRGRYIMCRPCRVLYSHHLPIVVATCVRTIQGTIFISPHYCGKDICADHSVYHIHITLLPQIHLCVPFRIPYSHHLTIVVETWVNENSQEKDGGGVTNHDALHLIFVQSALNFCYNQSMYHVALLITIF